MTQSSNDQFWQAKMEAFFHALGCQGLVPGLSGDETSQRINELCSRTAGAAERVPFPREEVLPHGDAPSHFTHPLCGETFAPAPFPGKDEFRRGVGKTLEAMPKNLSWKDQFLWCWRYLPEQCAHLKGITHRFYSQDSRLLDSTIWGHGGVTSAMRACVETQKPAPAFLLFQLGGAQSFISQAQTTRDLRSGSYILSWLMARTMVALAQEIGPDNLIFPNLRGQPLIDFFLCPPLFSGSTSDVLDLDSLLVPTLPNRFFALVPQSRGEELARMAEQTLREELKNMGDQVQSQLNYPFSNVDRKRWRQQIELHPQITWYVLPWNKDPHQALGLFHAVDFEKDTAISPSKNLQNLYTMVCEHIPPEDRDPIHYKDPAKKELDNPGFGWAAFYSATEFALAGRRKTRDFCSFYTDEHQKGSQKDELSGMEEVIGTSPVQKGDKTGLGKLGAMNIIKRHFFHHVLPQHLQARDPQQRVQLFEKDRFISTPEMAKRGETADFPYFAVLAMDGDQMGMWVSGQKAPLFKELLSDHAKKYFDTLPQKQWQSLKRPLSPGWHLQFSEALGNFSLYLAGSIVEYYQGQLIYAGGDDVLAMLPSDKALDCAAALRGAFRGVESEIPQSLREKYNMRVHAPGVISVGEGLPFLVPGPRADISCGIAVAGETHPLQSVVREALAQESRAKKSYQRGAFAMALLKRSGEIMRWGGRWPTVALGSLEEDGSPRSPSQALPLFQLYSRLVEEEKLSHRFPYVLAQLGAPYRLDRWAPPGETPKEELSLQEELDSRELRSILWREFQHVLERQRTEKGKKLALRGKSLEEEAENPKKNDSSLLSLGASYLLELSGSTLQDFTNLFLTSAFVFRKRPKKEEGSR